MRWSIKLSGFQTRDAVSYSCFRRLFEGGKEEKCRAKRY